MKNALVLLLLLAACDDAEPSRPDAETTRTVTGTQISSYRRLDGTLIEQHPADLHATLVQAHHRDADGTWHIAPGNGRADGSFTVTGLPKEGHYWLRLARRPAGDEYVWTDADQVSFDDVVLGPSDPARDDEGPIALHIAASQLSPWQEGDGLALFVPDDVIYVQDTVAGAASGAPAPGDVAVDDLRLDWVGRILADVDEGEPAFLVQYQDQVSADGVAFRAPVRSLSPGPYAQAPRTDTQIGGAMAAPPALGYRLAWTLSAFEALRGDVHPVAAGASNAHYLSVFAQPGVRDDEMWSSVEYPLVQILDRTMFAGGQDVDRGELEVPNPYPGEWLLSSHVVTFPVSLALPSGELPTEVVAAIGVRQRLADGPAVPLLGPVTSPAIGGRLLFAVQNVVGLDPEISSEPPAVGVPTAVQITLVRAVVAPPPPYRPGWYLHAVFTVPGDVSRVPLPAGVLEEGEHYAIVIKAVASDVQDVRVAPYRVGADFAFAELVSSVFSP